MKAVGLLQYEKSSRIMSPQLQSERLIFQKMFILCSVYSNIHSHSLLSLQCDPFRSCRFGPRENSIKSLVSRLRVKYCSAKRCVPEQPQPGSHCAPGAHCRRPDCHQCKPGNPVAQACGTLGKRIFEEECSATWRGRQIFKEENSRSSSSSAWQLSLLHMTD